MLWSEKNSPYSTNIGLFSETTQGVHKLLRNRVRSHMCLSNRIR